jgi:hypothetical protein
MLVNLEQKDHNQSPVCYHIVIDDYRQILGLEPSSSIRATETQPDANSVEPSTYLDTNKYLGMSLNSKIPETDPCSRPDEVLVETKYASKAGISQQPIKSKYEETGKDTICIRSSDGDFMVSYGYGIVQLFREKYSKGNLDDPTDEGSYLKNVAAILTVPSYMTASDFFGFIN